jgi:pimeloyl-ACP methyl ester carboxylesterase
MNRLFAVLLFSISLISAGCAVVGVKVEKNSASTVRRDVVGISKLLNDSAKVEDLGKALDPKLPESKRCALLLDLLESTACAKPDSHELKINQIATRALIALMSSREFAPLQLSDGRSLRVSGDSRGTLDPRIATEVFPASGVKISKLRARTVQSGLGLPCVAHFAPSAAGVAGQPGVPKIAGLCEPVTALLKSSGKSAELVFYRTRIDDDVEIDGRRFKLAADFSAPLAYMLSKGRNRNIDIGALIRSDKNFANTGLYQFHRYDPEKIPVVFVHGLLSRPETWVPAVNELMADEKIRERYQFWFYLYPTGLPVWGSAAELRSELARYRASLDPLQKNPNFDRMVLVGHSMGGLVSSLQVRSGGEALWKQFMDTPPEKLALSPKVKERIIETVEFEPRSEVSRVVFFSTPHRGSYMAVHPATEFFSRLIRVPVNFLQSDVRAIQSVVRQEFRDLFTAPANSLVFLRANSPLLESILALPVRHGLKFHSIVGDQGKGDSPESSDGVVPYWSSFLKGAESKKIVPSGHGSHEHSEGIAELARILHLHIN